MTKAVSKRRALWPILITVFLDFLGIGIIIPVIPALFFESGNTFFAPSVSLETRSILYGFLIAAYPLMQFFGAPLLGTLSDRHGRKPLVSISLIGTCIGYVLFALAIGWQNIYLLFFSRMLPGFTGGNVSIMYSAIADVSSEKEKTANFGLIGMAFGIGFILGPATGGLLADSSVVSWFNPATPFWFTAILTAVNLLMVQWMFPETLKERKDVPLKPLKGLKNIIYSFRSLRLRVIMVVVLLLSLGFSFYTQFFSVYMYRDFAYSEMDIGLLYAWIGIWLAITQGFLVRKVSAWISSERILNVTLLGVSLSVFLVLWPSESAWMFVLNPFVAIAQGINMPNITTVVSSQASEQEQGEILGINQSMQSVGQVIPPLIAGYLNAMASWMPIAAAGIVLLTAWLVYVLFYKRQ